MRQSTLPESNQMLAVTVLDADRLAFCMQREPALPPARLAPVWNLTMSLDNLFIATSCSRRSDHAEPQ